MRERVVMTTKKGGSQAKWTGGCGWEWGSTSDRVGNRTGVGINDGEGEPTRVDGEEMKKGEAMGTWRAIGFLLGVMMMIGGCAGTGMRVQTAYQPTSGDKLTYTVVAKVAVSDQALSILRQEIDSQLQNSGMLATNPDEARKHVEISITNYYMRHGAVRALVGIMAGSDNMKSSVQVKDKQSQVVVGAFFVESTNPTAMWTSKGMIEEHAKKIVEYLKSGGR